MEVDPPAERLGALLLSEHVTVLPLHAKLTDPEKLLVDDRLIVTVPEPPAETGTMVVSGTMVKSESGLEMGLVKV